MNVRLHIDRLILDGVPMSAADRPRLQAAVEAELARLIEANGITPALASGIAPQITLAADTTQLGTSIAHAVYSGIGGTK
jgi:hypothetical protein